MTQAAPDAGQTLRLQVREAVDWIQSLTANRPRVGLVLGSGLGFLADDLDRATRLPYRDIPHFPHSTAPGHAGTLALGSLEGQEVAVMAGRVHLYEGYTAAQVAFPIRVLRALGAEILIVTNAAGGVNAAFHPGSLMLITDQINLTGQSPLVGPNDHEFGVRFPDMSEAYAGDLRRLAHRAAATVEVPLEEGVYLGLLGPAYETPAEIRMARILGADAVGMSTVLEVIAAVHGGMRVLGLSCITNMAAGMLPQKLTEEEVFETARRVAPQFGRVIRAVVRALPDTL